MRCRCSITWATLQRPGWTLTGLAARRARTLLSWTSAVVNSPTGGPELAQIATVRDIGEEAQIAHLELTDQARVIVGRVLVFTAIHKAAPRLKSGGTILLRASHPATGTRPSARRFGLRLPHRLAMALRASLDCYRVRQEIGACEENGADQSGTAGKPHPITPRHRNKTKWSEPMTAMTLCTLRRGTI